MVEFTLVYSMAKVVRVMAAGTVFMTAALLVCRFADRGHWRFKLGMLCLVPLACLTAYSKIFYTGKIVWFTGFTQQMISKELAVCYFSAAGVLALRNYWMGRRLRRRLCRMQRMDDPALPAGWRRWMEETPAADARRIPRAAPAGAWRKLRTCGVHLCGLFHRKSPKIQVYVTDDNSSGPFAGGVLKPYIVIPRRLIESLTEEEFSAILYHEALHLRLGHVILLHIFAALKIVWWIHPFIYLCDRALRENIEYSSDEGSLSYGALSVYAYATVMLKTLYCKNEGRCIGAGVTTFAPGSYQILKNRMEKLGTFHPNPHAGMEYQKKKKRLHRAVGLFVSSGALLLLLTCYPRFTKLKEIAVYDDQLKPVTFDLAAEGIHVQAEEEKFQISKEEFQKLVARHRPKGEYLVFSYDTIMKVPGVGGGGQAVMVNIEDPSDVFIIGRYTWKDRVKLFMMKYFM